MLEQIVTNKGESLVQLSNTQKVLIVFLRHFGCTFCMEAMVDIAKRKEQITNARCKLVFIHLSDNEKKADAFFSRYGMQHESRIADSSGKLHELFEVKSGNIWQLLGPVVLWRFFVVGIIKGFGVNKIQGDVTFLPGTFVLHKGKIIQAYRGKRSSDKTHIAALESCSIA